MANIEWYGGGVLTSPYQTTMFIYNSLGEKIQMSDVQAVEALLALKRRSGSNPWPVIEKCIEIWETKRPNEWKAFLVEIELTKKTRKNNTASSEGKGGRYLLDIPEKVMFMIRGVYSAEELPMNKEFLREFAQRFSKFAIPKNL